MSTPTLPASLPQYQTSSISIGQITQADLKDPNLGMLNQWKTQIENQINAISGTGGATKMPAGIDVQGQGTVTNLPAPSSKTSTDAASAAHVEQNYSASALAPQLEAGNNTGLKSYRALNSPAQTENYSNFLEGMLNTSPTSNTSTISQGTTGNEVVVSAGSHQFVSGRVQNYAQRTDTLALPAAATIASITRAANIVTATLTATSTLIAGDSVAVEGVTDTTYDGVFTLLTSTGGGMTVSWAQNGPDSTSSGGTVATNTTYYYYASQNSATLALAGPYTADTQTNRVAVNKDGTVLIATAVLNSSGLDLTQSAAGATPPSTTNGNRLLARL
jgi:hypothetical protein